MNNGEAKVFAFATDGVSRMAKASRTFSMTLDRDLVALPWTG